jgi:hypothetical protein
MPPPAGQYGYQQPAPVPGGRLAGMGARLGGLIIDWIIVGVPSALLGIAFGAYHKTTTCDAYGECHSGVQFTSTLSVDLIGLVLGLAYSAYFVGMTGQTIGHRAVGIKIVDARSGGLIGPGRGALRWLVMSVTGAICTLGYWSPFFDSQRRQGWHDKATNSVAIPSR